MTTFDPRGTDVNSILRDALHQRGTAVDIDGPLSEAVSRALPAEAAPRILAALQGTVRRCMEEEGLDGGDALHSILANLSRYEFFLEPGGEPWVARDGRLVKAAEVKSSPVSSPAAAPPAAGGGCLGLLAVAALGLAALV